MPFFGNSIIRTVQNGLSPNQYAKKCVKIQFCLEKSKGNAKIFAERVEESEEFKVKWQIFGGREGRIWGNGAIGFEAYVVNNYRPLATISGK